MDGLPCRCQLHRPLQRWVVTLSVVLLTMYCMIPQANNHEKETAGFVLSFFLQFGIFVGSQVALGVKDL